MEIITIKRTFKFNEMILDDPGDHLSPLQVMEHYALIYPELTNAKIVSKGIENDTDRYEFSTNLGTKG